METAPVNDADRAALQFAMRLSLWIGGLMLVMKTGAYWITGSTAPLPAPPEAGGTDRRAAGRQQHPVHGDQPDPHQRAWADGRGGSESPRPTHRDPRA